MVGSHKKERWNRKTTYTTNLPPHGWISVNELWPPKIVLVLMLLFPWIRYKIDTQNEKIKMIGIPTTWHLKMHRIIAKVNNHSCDFLFRKC